MSVPVLSLNLAPRPSLWRQRHQVLGWSALGCGLLVLVGSIGFTWYRTRIVNSRLLSNR